MIKFFKKKIKKTNNPSNVTPSINPNKKVDEDIFSDLAPEIEDLVLAEGVDEGVIERDFSVQFPKYGNGDTTYIVKKHVKVIVQDMCE